MEITLLLALILTVGFVAAKAGQTVRLPSVTGFIAAGVLLGPSGFNIISEEATGNQLRHFTQIALMLIAFGIGEHLELKRLKHTAKTVLAICLVDTFFALFFVAGGVFLITWWLDTGGPGWYFTDYMMLAVTLGTVSIATAPGTILFITRECRAVGPMTTTLLQVVAVNNGLAIVFFGLALVFARQVAGAEQMVLGTIFTTVLVKISVPLVLGVATGLIIDFIIHRLRDRGEMLTIGLALLLLSGELARYFNFSPLLVGIAIGFTIVNRDRRDVRLFRTLNTFEPPIYVLFFTIAGAHLDISSLGIAGWLGFVYFLLRSFGKISGAYLGGILGGAPHTIRKNLGIALVPQAGIAIGLVFLVNGDPDLHAYAAILTPTVLVGVLFAELIGPSCTKHALEKSGEAVCGNGEESGIALLKNGAFPIDETIGTQFVPWSWEKLRPAISPKGFVLFGISDQETVNGLTRMATIIAHYLMVQPVAVRVAGKENTALMQIEAKELLESAALETENLGYPFRKLEMKAESTAKGLVTACMKKKPLALLLGYPLQATEQSFNKIVEEVSAAAGCSIVVARFSGILHTERILVPVIHSTDLEIVGDVLCAMAHTGKHSITLLRLLSFDVQGQGEAEYKNKLESWAVEKKLPFIQCIVTKTEARLETILKETLSHDLLIMAVSSESFGIKKILLGSLADDVASNCQRPILIVHPPRL